MSHAPRLPYPKLATKPFNALLHLSETVWSGSLGKRLVDLVFLRVSQINGCAYCIDMHWRDLVKLGVDERHLNAVAGWREAPFFDARERAALQWAESVARIPHADPSDEAFAQLQAHFSDTEIAELGFAIATTCSYDSTMYCIQVTVTYPYAANPLVPAVALFDAVLPNTLTSQATVQINPTNII